MVQTNLNRCVVSVFDYRVAPWETVSWQEEEVEWGSFVPWDEVGAGVRYTGISRAVFLRFSRRCRVMCAAALGGPRQQAKRCVVPAMS